MKNTSLVVGMCCIVMSFGLMAESRAQSAPKESPLFATSAQKANDRLDARIFPLGWSADGKFAWLTRMVEEATDEGDWSLTVLDTKTDKAVHEEEFQVPDTMKDGAAKLWTAKAKHIQPILKKHGIKEQAVAMDHLPVVLGKQRDLVVTAEIVPKKRALEEVGIGMGVESYTVNLRLGEKETTVLQQKFEYTWPYAVSVAGCFHSPDQKFGVLVVTELHPGYEGPPNYRVYRTAGFVTNVKERNGAMYEKLTSEAKKE